MSTLEVNTVTAGTLNSDLSLEGNGTGVVDLGAGYKVNGTVETMTGVAPGTSGNLLTSNGSAWTSAAAGGLSVYAGGDLQGGTTTTSHLTWTNVVMTETADSGTTFDGTTFTVPAGEGGTYYISGGVEGTFVQDGQTVGIRFYKNGTTSLGELFAQSYGIPSDNKRMKGNTAYIGTLAAADTIVLQAQFGDSNANNYGDITAGNFQIFKIA